MKSCAGVFAAAVFGLAAAQTSSFITVTEFAHPSSVTFYSASAPVATGSWPVAAPAPSSGAAGNSAICGQGFTYCGYILRDHQNFKEEDIVKAYCAGNKDNCANGKTKTDPIQALYVCLPPNATPKHRKMIKARQAGTSPTSTLLSSPGGNTCSATAQTGNAIELLCSCGGSCLNPASDHIGRCDAPCS
ncbi:hypothetical protein B0T19DRAFT_441469 [Cercophora scortea]|uniref:Uncharacterized protein n=1 Tax=Cercophora scortea TaxID=314031 RepID=A0AAE0IMH3_9PEZI|nr:hypothetical protein B0T19DRAFT_441469 [Cercophora scortea]